MSRTAGTGIGASILALVLAAAGPILAHWGVIGPLVGLKVLVLGAAVALVGAIVLIVAVVRDGTLLRRLGRWFVIDGVIVVAVMASAVAGRTVPRINDITTDPAQPPELRAAARLTENAGRDLSYDRTFAAIQKNAYPDVVPIKVPWPPEKSFEKALAVARELGWDVHASNPSERRFEATERSRLFRFVDDVVAVVAADGEGAVINLRSKSRDGKGDFGVNARRIRLFRSKLLGG